MSIYRVQENQSKLARDLMDARRKLRANLAELEAVHETMIQAQNNWAATLTVRSDNTSGQVTFGSGSLPAGTLFNLHWNGGSRAGVVAGTPNGSNTPFSGGSGDNLPAQDTAVTVVHYSTLAAEAKIVDVGGTADANDAYGLFNELASVLAVSSAAIKQFYAKIVNYNG